MFSLSKGKLIAFEKHFEISVKGVGGYYLCCGACWRKMNARTNGTRGNMKTMAGEKLLLALQSSH